MAEKRLSGSKNYLYFGALGASIVGDGSTPLAVEGYHKITARIDAGLDSALALAVSLKASINAHYADASEHTTAIDNVNTLVAADPDDVPSLIVSVTEMITSYVAHDDDAELASLWAYHAAQEAGDHSLASVAAPVNLHDCIVRLNDIQTKYNAHDADGTAHGTDSEHQDVEDAAAGSAWPVTAGVGDVIFNKPAYTPEVGDDCRLLTLTKLGFVTNIPQSASKEKFEDTIQTDDVKSYSEGDKPEITGNVEGYFVAEASKISDILNRFFRVVSDNGAGTRTYAPTTTGAIHFMLGRNEVTTTGEIAIMEYMPAIVESLTVDKPMEGKQPFGFAYTVVGSERPSVYNRAITA